MMKMLLSNLPTIWKNLNSVFDILHVSNLRLSVELNSGTGFWAQLFITFIDVFFRASAFQQKLHLPCEDGELRAHRTSEPVCPVAADPTKHAHTGKGSISMADLSGDVKCMRVMCACVSGQMVQFCWSATFTGQQLSGCNGSRVERTFIE